MDNNVLSPSYPMLFCFFPSLFVSALRSLKVRFWRTRWQQVANDDGRRANKKRRKSDNGNTNANSQRKLRMARAINCIWCVTLWERCEHDEGVCEREGEIHTNSTDMINGHERWRETMHTKTMAKTRTRLKRSRNSSSLNMANGSDEKQKRRPKKSPSPEHCSITVQTRERDEKKSLICRHTLAMHLLGKPVSNFCVNAGKNRRKKL